MVVITSYSIHYTKLYDTNIRHLLSDMCPEKNGEINVDMEDEVIRGTTVIKNGEITWPPPAPKLSAAPKQAPAKAPVLVKEEPKKPSVLSLLIPFIVGGLVLFGLGLVAPPSFMQHFTVFVV